mgnify:CR=1 FL=1
MTQFELYMLRKIRKASNLDTALFRPLVRWYRDHKEQDFWQLAWTACTVIDRSSLILTETETERLKDFSDKAYERMQSSDREIASLITKYGWEA